MARHAGPVALHPAGACALHRCLDGATGHRLELAEAQRFIEALEPDTCADLTRAVLSFGHDRYSEPCARAQYDSPLLWRLRNECLQLDEASALLRAHCAPCAWHVYLDALRRAGADVGLVLEVAAELWPHLCEGGR